MCNASIYILLRSDPCPVCTELLTGLTPSNAKQLTVKVNQSTLSRYICYMRSAPILHAVPVYGCLSPMCSGNPGTVGSETCIQLLSCTEQLRAFSESS